MKKRNLYNDFLSGTFPVGINAGTAAFFIILIYALG